MKGGNLVGSDLADNADTEAWTGKWLAFNDFIGETQFAAHLANLVFEQAPQRFNQREFDVVRQSADVVVALDRGSMLPTRLNDVGVKRSLNQETGLSHLSLCSFKNTNEELTNCLSFRLRFGDTY